MSTVRQKPVPLAETILLSAIDRDGVVHDVEIGKVIAGVGLQVEAVPAAQQKVVVYLVRIEALVIWVREDVDAIAAIRHERVVGDRRVATRGRIDYDPCSRATELETFDMSEVLIHAETTGVAARRLPVYDCFPVRAQEVEPIVGRAAAGTGVRQHEVGRQQIGSCVDINGGADGWMVTADDGLDGGHRGVAAQAIIAVRACCRAEGVIRGRSVIHII